MQLLPNHTTPSPNWSKSCKSTA